MNEQQSAAIAARGHVFVSAGAGTGKTAVLVERFAEAVCERGLPVDSVLVITYTERAAGELRGRIRRRLQEAGRHDLARALDGAWISTIHGFCLRLLKAHPFAAGIDPRFRVLDESQGRVLRSEAFAAALEEFCGGGDPERLRLLTTYGASRLRSMLTGIYETLRSAGRPLELEPAAATDLTELVAALRDAAACVVGDERASERGRERAARLLDFLGDAREPEALRDLAEFRAQGERFATYEEARRATEQAAWEDLARRDRALLEGLLTGFAAEYAAAKERESALDFEDLQLVARDLLRDRPEIRGRERWRFRELMVDEFQDTNRLQCELIDLLAGDEVFFVGDEFQSIYGFRHADVQVFRERRRGATNVLPLTRNYRSRPEVLAAINHLFEEDFGDDFQPLAASREFPDPVFGIPVELLVTDKASFAGDGGVHWRRAEARQVAARVKELVDGGAAEPGEIVLLFAAGTDAEWYEEELRALGLPTFRATGRGYFGQQQVLDLLAYLRLLHNRYDDEALVTVLASPFVGVSNDALVLLRRTAGRRPLFVGLERDGVAGATTRDARLFQAFKQRYERLASAAPSLSLERLCERILTEHDYDLAVLAQWDGSRRYANLRKLARLARSYEDLRGPDVEGFVRFVREQEAAGARELEAVASEEDSGVIRLLTIHAAKGLEFKVVVVADAGRDTGGVRSPDEILALPDGRVGFRVLDPDTGERRAVSGYDTVKDERRREEEAERRRLYYVAMTRAIDRLIVSGSIDFERSADTATPIGWALRRLDAPEVQSATAPLELERAGARFLIRLNRFSERAEDAAEEAAADQLALFEVRDGHALLPPAPELPELAPVPVPPVERVRRLSFSSLALFERCSYRYYAERVVGLAPVDGAGRVPGQTGLAATEIGDAVHGLLERVDLAAPEAPPSQETESFVLGRYPGATEVEVARIGHLVAAYTGSEFARRVAALPGARPERPFAFEHDGVLLRGRLDVLYLARAEGRALVVDYKTNVLGEAAPEAVVEREYRLQRLVYALACFRAGVDEVEVAYQFLERPDEVVSAMFARDDISALEAELSAAIDEIQQDQFRPTPSEFACAGCPALDVVCAGPRLPGAGPVEAPLPAVAASA